MDTKSVNQLRVFVEALKSNPDLLHDPSIEFFKDYLLSLGATVCSVARVQSYMCFSNTCSEL